MNNRDHIYTLQLWCGGQRSALETGKTALPLLSSHKFEISKTTSWLNDFSKYLEGEVFMNGS